MDYCKCCMRWTCGAQGTSHEMAIPCGNYIPPTKATNEELAKFLMDFVQVVRCVDCKHRPYQNPNAPFGPSYMSDDEVCPYVCEDPYYTDIPADNSYCDRGERG